MNWEAIEISKGKSSEVSGELLANLAHVVERAISPDTWRRLGGEGSISPLLIKKGDAQRFWLVVWQSQDVITEVRKFLKTIQVVD